MRATVHPVSRADLEREQLPRSESPQVSVIVPVTERPSPLDWVYEQFSVPLKKRGVAYEFLFLVERWGVDLARRLDGLIAAGEPIRVFEVGRRVGESAMLEAALVQSEGRILLTLPAYPRVRPEGIGVLLDAVDAGADLATARRVTAGETLPNRIQNKAFHALLKLGVGGNFEDVASGVRAMRREVLEEVPVYGDFFRFLPVLVEREGFRVEEVPVPQHPDDARTRIYSPGVYLRRSIDLLGLFFLSRFTRKPLRFFGLFGVVISGVGAAILALLFVQRVGGRSVADRPLLLLGVLLFVLGVQAVGIGLIGEIIVHLSADGGRREYRTKEDIGIPAEPVEDRD